VIDPDKTQEEKKQEEKDAEYQELCDEYARLCLDGLKLEERELIVEYHSGGDEEGDSKRRRKEIAKRFGINTKALTKRAGRIRKKLDDCVAKRFAEAQTG
jgi:DNA-directed RNA polymerase specialized sigma24 family protein